MALRGTGTGGVSIMRKVVVFSVLSLILLFSSASITFGQVQTRIRAIEASNVGSRIDPSLRDIHGELGSLFNFTSYRLLRDETLNLVLNRPVSIQGRNPGRFMEVTLVGQHKDNAQIRIRVIREGADTLNTQVRLSAGRTVLVGGPRRGEGVIIFAVSARF
jgi:hypothetical protein